MPEIPRLAVHRLSGANEGDIGLHTQAVEPPQAHLGRSAGDGAQHGSLRHMGQAEEIAGERAGTADREHHATCPHGLLNPVGRSQGLARATQIPFKANRALGAQHAEPPCRAVVIRGGNLAPAGELHARARDPAEQHISHGLGPTRRGIQPAFDLAGQKPQRVEEAGNRGLGRRPHHRAGGVRVVVALRIQMNVG